MNIKMDMLAHACNTGEGEKGISEVQGQPGLHNVKSKQASKQADKQKSKQANIMIT